MHVIGEWCPRVDTPEGSAKFQEDYDLTPDEYIVKYDLTNITTFTNKNKTHIAFVEYDGTINQLFTLKDGESIEVCADARLSYLERAFNSDCISFFHLIRNGEKVATFYAENSPYDMEEEHFEVEKEDFDDNCYTKKSLINNVQNLLLKSNFQIPATEDNILFVRQL